MSKTEQTPNGLATYSSPDFREYPSKIYKDTDGKMVEMVLCEELDPESGRWEAFVSIVAEEATR